MNWKGIFANKEEFEQPFAKITFTKGEKTFWKIVLAIVIAVAIIFLSVRQAHGQQPPVPTAQATNMPNMFPTDEACDAAFKSGNFVFYKPLYHYKGKKGYVGKTKDIPLEAVACVHMWTTAQWQWVLQEVGVEMRWGRKADGTWVLVARTSCKNPADRLFYPGVPVAAKAPPTPTPPAPTPTPPAVTGGGNTTAVVVPPPPISISVPVTIQQQFAAEQQRCRYVTQTCSSILGIYTSCEMENRVASDWCAPTSKNFLDNGVQGTYVTMHDGHGGRSRVNINITNTSIYTNNGNTTNNTVAGGGGGHHHPTPTPTPVCTPGAAGCGTVNTGNSPGVGTGNVHSTQGPVATATTAAARSQQAVPTATTMPQAPAPHSQLTMPQPPPTAPVGSSVVATPRGPAQQKPTPPPSGVGKKRGKR